MRRFRSALIASMVPHYHSRIMCGRYALVTSSEVIASFFGADAWFDDFTPRYNIAPTQCAPVVADGHHADPDGPASEPHAARHIELMRWGLIPSWAKDASIGNRLINARSESAATKPAFRNATKKRRCIVPISGFYEWQRRDRRKQPFYIRRADNTPIGGAGLWEHWTDPDSGESIHTYTILTTDASDDLSDLHDRMPVLLEPESFDEWLDPRTPVENAQQLLKPAANGVLERFPVSTRVNTPHNDDPSLIEPINGTDDAGGMLFDHQS